MRRRRLPVMVLIGVLASASSAARAACMDGACEAGPPFALPIALSACVFETPCPSVYVLRNVPDGTTSFWTNLTDARRGTPTLVERIPSQCCDGRRCGGGAELAFLSVGDPITIWSGRSGRTLSILEDCVTHAGFDRWIVPIVPCGATRGIVPVVGFTEVVVDFVDTRGGIALRTECVPSSGSPP